MVGNDVSYRVGRNRGANDVDRHVGQRLRQRRILLGMSLEQLAETVELTYQQVQKYERAVNRISAGRLHRIAHALDVPVGYFFDGLDSTQESIPIVGDDGRSKRETLELLRGYDNLPSPVRKAVRSLFRELASDGHEVSDKS